MHDIFHLRSLQHHERFINVHDHERTRITSTVEHHTVFRNRNGRKQQTVLSSRLHSRTTRSTSVHFAEVAQLTISVAQRHSWLPTVFVVLWLESPISTFFTMASIALSWIEPCVAIFSIPSVASPGVFIGLDEACQRLFLPLSKA